ncbi:hypothetical protein [Streptomyces sp. NPDC004830]
MCPARPAPSPGPWRAAWAHTLTEERTAQSRAGLGWALTGLASGAFPALDLLEIGCEWLRLTRLTCPPTGSGPRSVRLAERPWSELPAAAALLPGRRAERLLLLAGAGHDTAPERGSTVHTALHEALCTAVDDVLPDAYRDKAAPLVLALRATGWSPLQRVAEDLHGRLGALLCLRLPAHWPTGPEDLAAELPLPVPVWLAAAHVDGASGTVGLVRRTLFPAGSRAGDGTAAGQIVQVPVSAPAPGAGVGESVAAVVRAGIDEPAAAWRPLRMDRLTLPPGSRTTLRYSLHAGHRVGLLGETDHAPETTAWAVLAGSTARQLPRPCPVDLLIAVEIAGPQADGGTVVAERLQEAATVVTAVQDAIGDEAALRVGLIGYRDHDPLHRPGHQDPVVHRIGMCTAADAARVLTSWRPYPLRHDFATGLEHLPGEVYAWRHLWRAGSHRVLLTVGSRPPYPHVRPPRVVQRGAPVRICPDRLDWRTDLQAIRHGEDIACLAVVDEPAWMDDLHGEPHLARWADHAWHAFGAEGRYPAGHDPERIASAVVAPALCPPEGGAPIRLVVADGPAGDWRHAPAG